MGVLIGIIQIIGRAIHRMRRVDHRNAVAADCGVIGRRCVQSVRGIDFLGLLETLEQAKVGRMKLRLIYVVIDRLAGNSVPKADFGMFLVIDKPLAGPVVERGLAAFRFELR